MTTSAARQAANAAPRAGLWLALAAAIVFVVGAVWCYELGAAVYEYCPAAGSKSPCVVKPTDPRAPPAAAVAAQATPAPAAPQADEKPKKDLGFLHDVRGKILTRNGNFANPTLSISAEAPYLLMCLSMLMGLGAIGLGINGLLAGALIDDRNRLSLTMTQAATWGVLLFPAIAAFAIINVGYGARGEFVFPSFANTWVLLGIVGISPVASKAVLGMLGTPGGSAAAGPQSDPPPPVAVPNYLDRNAQPRDAALWDLVISETAGADHLVDMNRVQHVAMTIILLSIYLTQLTAMVSIIHTPVDGTFPLLGGLPDVSTSFLSILAVSHATLIGGKWSASRTVPAAPPAT